MIRGLLTFAILCAVPFAVLAQDEEECLVPQRDIAVEISETQAVVWRVSGGAHIEDASVKRSVVPATAKADAALYEQPDADEGAVIVPLESGTALMIFGRSADSRWLYVGAPENPSGHLAGWLLAQDASVIGIVTLLPVIDTEILLTSLPFQAVHIPPESCVASEIAGALVQSSGEAFALIVANGVEIQLDGTAFVRPVGDTLTVSVIAGRAIVGGDIFVPSGAAAVIALESEPEIVTYDDKLLSGLPLDAIDGSPFTAVEVAPALAESEIEAAVSELFAP